MSRLKLAAALLTGALAATCWWGWLMLDHAGQDAQALADANGRQEEQVVSDTPAEQQVPLYLQTDERWGGLPYADADLATSGCGLTCAAMAWQYLSGKEWTPVQMLNAVGNDYVQEGQNYMPGFCSWMQSNDPSISYSVIYEDRDRALRDLGNSMLVFGAMEGRLHEGGRSYAGHVVLLTGIDGESATVHDPCEAYPVALTHDEFNAVSWDYFISVGRSE